MSEGTGDLSRIVSLIMQNPKLIEEISNLAKSTGSGSVDERQTDEVSESTESTESALPTEQESVSSSTVPILRQNGNAARAQLLTALKPYVSKERAGAIDSMISIAEILDVMRAR